MTRLWPRDCGDDGCDRHRALGGDGHSRAFAVFCKYASSAVIMFGMTLGGSSVLMPSFYDELKGLLLMAFPLLALLFGGSGSSGRATYYTASHDYVHAFVVPDGLTFASADIDRVWRQFPGHPWLDVPETTWTLLVYTSGRIEIVGREDRFWLEYWDIEQHGESACYDPRVGLRSPRDAVEDLGQAYLYSFPPALVWNRGDDGKETMTYIPGPPAWEVYLFSRVASVTCTGAVPPESCAFWNKLAALVPACK